MFRFITASLLLASGVASQGFTGATAQAPASAATAAVAAATGVPNFPATPTPIHDFSNTPVPTEVPTFPTTTGPNNGNGQAPCNSLCLTQHFQCMSTCVNPDGSYISSCQDVCTSQYNACFQEYCSSNPTPFTTNAPTAFPSFPPTPITTGAPTVILPNSTFPSSTGGSPLGSSSSAGFGSSTAASPSSTSSGSRTGGLSSSGSNFNGSSSTGFPTNGTISSSTGFPSNGTVGACPFPLFTTAFGTFSVTGANYVNNQFCIITITPNQIFDNSNNTQAPPTLGPVPNNNTIVNVTTATPFSTPAPSSTSAPQTNTTNFTTPFPATSFPTTSFPTVTPTNAPQPSSSLPWFRIDFPLFESESCCDSLTIVASSSGQEFNVWSGRGMHTGQMLFIQAQSLRFEWRTDLSAVAAGWIVNYQIMAILPQTIPAPATVIPFEQPTFFPTFPPTTPPPSNNGTTNGTTPVPTPTPTNNGTFPPTTPPPSNNGTTNGTTPVPTPTPTNNGTTNNGSDPTGAPSGNSNGGLSYIPTMTDADWLLCKQMIGEIINTGHGPVLVRNSFHDAGTFDVNNPSVGGPHASMRFTRIANFRENRGLELARSLLSPIKLQFGDKISHADLWHFAAAVVVSNSGGPLIPFRAGRADATQSMLPAEGLLPDAEPEIADFLRQKFSRMGFPDRAIVTLSGAHVLGACHLQNSGYSGQWTRDNTRFSNQYFKNMVQLDYGFAPLSMPPFHDPVSMQPGQFDPKSQWNATSRTDPQTSTGNIMILNTDFVLRTVDDQFKLIVQQYAQNQAVFYQDFTQFFVQMQELGMNGQLQNQVIDVIIPGFNQTTPQGPTSAPSGGNATFAPTFPPTTVPTTPRPGNATTFPTSFPTGNTTTKPGNATTFPTSFPTGNTTTKPGNATTFPTSFPTSVPTKPVPTPLLTITHRDQDLNRVSDTWNAFYPVSRAVSPLNFVSLNRHFAVVFRGKPSDCCEGIFSLLPAVGSLEDEQDCETLALHWNNKGDLVSQPALRVSFGGRCGVTPNEQPRTIDIPYTSNIDPSQQYHVVQIDYQVQTRNTTTVINTIQKANVTTTTFINQTSFVNGSIQFTLVPMNFTTEQFSMVSTTVFNSTTVVIVSGSVTPISSFNVNHAGGNTTRQFTDWPSSTFGFGSVNGWLINGRTRLGGIAEQGQNQVAEVRIYDTTLDNGQQDQLHQTLRQHWMDPTFISNQSINFAAQTNNNEQVVSKAAPASTSTSTSSTSTIMIAGIVVGIVILACAVMLVVRRSRSTIRTSKSMHVNQAEPNMDLAVTQV